MAELKKFEYIIEFEPYYMENESGELCFKSKKVKQLVRCRDCKYSYDTVGGWCCSHGICVDCIVREDFFCADGEKREES